MSSRPDTDFSDEASRRAAEGDIVIHVEGLRKRFGDFTVVKGLTMRIGRGQIYGFLGPNGSGKTTAIRMMCGLLRPDGGRGTFLGLDLDRDVRRFKPLVGYMSQRFSLYDDLTVAENLEFACRMYGVRNRSARIAQVLEEFGLGERARQQAGTLSGGWKQRLSLATCLVHRPAVLLLDEPTAGVDPRAREEFWTHIRKVAAEGISVLVSTHYMDEAERCNRIAYLAYGDLLADDTPERLRRQCGLTATTAHGDNDLDDIKERLAAMSSENRVYVTGNTLRVVSRDQNWVAAVRAGNFGLPGRWQADAPQLEDVFFDLMRRSGGDRERAAESRGE